MASLDPDTFQTADGTGIKWGKLAGRIGRGSLYAIFVGTISIVLTTLRQVRGFVEAINAALASLIRVFFPRGGGPIMQAFEAARGALPGGVLPPLIAIAILASVLYAISWGVDQLVE